MMTTSLPAINQTGKANQSPTIQQHRIINPPGMGGSPTMSSKSYLKPARRSQGKKDREILMKQELLRARQPDLSKKDTAWYRNTVMHNLCLDMLQEGYHKSFSELFSLVEQRKKQREIAGPESALWNVPMLQDEHEKLETLKILLTRAESAFRKEDHVQVYQSRYQLAQYFLKTEDKWLSDHFFASCLDTSKNIPGHMQAEAHCNMGLAYEESGYYHEAASEFESFHEMSSENLSWKAGDNRTLLCVACEHLSRVYSTISSKLESSDPESSLKFLIQAYEKSKGSDDKLLEGKAGYRLGKAYQKQRDPQQALSYLNVYLEICKEAGDDTGTGQACEAIAKAYESQGKIQESIQYLEMFCEIAEKAKQEKELSQACSSLGTIFNSLGRYDKAVEYFGKAYNQSRALSDAESIRSSRVLFGVAQAHHMLGGIADHIDTANRPCLQRLVDWKNFRTEDVKSELISSVSHTPADQTQPSTTAPSETKDNKEDEDKSEETLDKQESS